MKAFKYFLLYNFISKFSFRILLFLLMLPEFQCHRQFCYDLKQSWFWKSQRSEQPFGVCSITSALIGSMASSPEDLPSMANVLERTTT